MIKDKAQRRGIALGAIFAFVASFFGATPAQAAVSTDAFTIVAAGDDASTFATFIDDDFTLLVARNAAEVSETDFNSYLHYSITTTRTYGSTYSITVDTSTESGTAVHTVVTGEEQTGQVLYYDGSALSSTANIPGTVSGNIPAAKAYVVQPSHTASGVAQKISFRLDGGAVPLTSASPSVDVTVTAFLDLNQNNKWDSATEPSKTQAFSFKKYSEVAPTVTVGAVEAATSHVTASATFTGLNVGQLPGKFALRFTAYNSDGLVSAVSYSAIAEQTPTKTLGYSMSDNITLTTAAAAGNTISAQLVYDSVSSYAVLGTDGTTEQALTKFGLTTVTVAAPSVTGATLWAVTGDNAAHSAGDVYDVRPNSLMTVRATFSGVASASATTATWTFDGVTLDATKTMSVNGGTAEVTGTHSAVTGTVNKVTGVAEITILTSGFGLSDNLTVSVKVPGLAKQSIALDTVAEVWSYSANAEVVSLQTGASLTLPVTVKDQWDVNSTRTNQRVKYTWTAGYSGTSTVSYATVTGGVATATLTPSHAGTTVAATVQMQLQYQDGSVWTDAGTAINTTVNVTATANSFRTGLAASYSASISYGAAFSWSAAISEAYVLNTGSAVVVSGEGLIFRDANDSANTGSGTITLPGNSTGQVSFEVTARLAGSYTVTLTSGAASTTSLIVVNPARSDDGASIIWDTTAIAAGKSKIVTGTVVDANGNPVDTTAVGSSVGDSGTASILVTYAGTAGIPVGTMPTETDADGKFKVSVFTTAADSGTFTLTATYLPQGSATATAKKVTSVQAITVGEVTDEASDKKITVGTFKGYVAIYTKGYMGQKLSAKVAGKWLVVDPIAAYKSNDYSRTVRLTGAGYTIMVDLYIDGVFVRSEVVTTK